MWLRTACLLFSTRYFLNMERHIRLAAGSLNSYVQVLKAAKWNLGLGGTIQTTHVDVRGHYTDHSCRFIFPHKMSDQRKILFFPNIRCAAVASFICKCSKQVCGQISFCLAGASGQQLFYSVCVCVCVFVCVCVCVCQRGVTWGGDRRMDILIAIRPT